MNFETKPPFTVEVRKVIKDKPVGEEGDSEFIVSVTPAPNSGSQSVTIICKNEIEAIQIAFSSHIILDFIK